MTRPRTQLAAAIAAALFATATVATAQDIAVQPALHKLGEHPAILVKRQVPQIDANTFIPMHPAGLFVIAAPSQTDDRSAVAAVPTTQPAATAGPMAGTGLRRSELSAVVAVSTTRQ